jgi:hypothetical protein
MKLQFLEDAIEQSLYHSAFRAGATDGIWQVRQENDAYTLIHIPVNPPGYPDLPLYPEDWTFQNLDDLVASESRLNAWFSGRDWIAVDDESRKRFKLQGF